MRVFAAGAAVALLTLLAVWASAAEAGGLRPVAAVPVNATLGLGPGEVSEPLTPLTKIDCGDGLAVVYGLPGGRPVVAVVYSNSSDTATALKECMARLEACLATMGARPMRLVAQAGEAEGNASRLPLLTAQSSTRPLTITATTPAEAAAEAVTVAPGGASQGGPERTPTPLSVRGAATGVTATSARPVTSTATGSPITWRGAQAESVPRQGAAWRPLAVLAAGSAAAAVAAAWARRAATP